MAHDPEPAPVSVSENDSRDYMTSILSAEDLARIEAFDALFLDWTGRLNLVAKSTLPQRWHRHYLDSWQLIPRIPDQAKTILDFGSGGGFPGVFLALLLADQTDKEIFLVESIAKKCAFLEAVKAEFTLEGLTILNQRIETVAKRKKADVITARALASLDKLLDYAKPHVSRETVCLFHKGEKWQEELTAAQKHWHMMAIPHQSMTHPDARILELKEIRRERTR